MVAFVTGMDNDAPPVKAAVHQLISLGIPFTGWQEQKLPSEFPENLDDFEGLVVDAARLRRTTPEERKRLEKFAKEHYVHIIPEYYLQLSSSECDMRFEVDFHIFAASSGISRPGMTEISEETILKEYFKLAEDYIKNIGESTFFNEYHLHFTASILEVEHLKAAPESLSSKIDSIWLPMADCVHAPVDGDLIGAWMVAPIAAKRTGNRLFLDRTLAAANDVLARWPRSNVGLLSPGGFSDDPLFFSHMDSCFFGETRSTNSRRDLHMNEQLHYVGAAFPALSMASGDHRFLNEAVRLMNYIDKVHRDPADGLLFHASRAGKPLGAKWGRGLSHALMGVFYMLRWSPNLPEDIVSSAIHFLDRTGRALVRFQTSNGFWRNVIDREDTPEETSCTVLFTYIFAYGVNHGWFDRSIYLRMIQKSRSALCRKFWRGRGSGDCRGTYPSPDLYYYLGRPFTIYVMPLIAPAFLEADRLLGAKQADGAEEK